MPNKVLLVTHLIKSPYTEGVPFSCCEECTDAFDVLDWIKQVNLSGRSVTVVDWRYNLKEST